MDLGWGWNPQTVEALATVAAFVGAGVVIFLELRRDSRADVDRAREQASKVSAWVSLVDGRPNFYWARVHNASDRPIYDVAVHIRVMGISASEVLSMVLPQRTETRTNTAHHEPPWETFELPIAVTFTDANGRKWVGDDVFPALRTAEEHAAAEARRRQAIEEAGSFHPSKGRPSRGPKRWLWNVRYWRHRRKRRKLT